MPKPRIDKGGANRQKRLFLYAIAAICLVLLISHEFAPLSAVEYNQFLDSLLQEEEEVGTTQLLLFNNSLCNGTAAEVLEASDGNPIVFPVPDFYQSLKVQGTGLAEFYHWQHYKGVLMELNGCSTWPGKTNVELHLYSAANKSTVFTTRQQISHDVQKAYSTAYDLSEPHIRIIFSVSSSHYFGYQVLANAYSFLQSNQTNASWTRLLTSRVPDDLSETIPTFTAPKCTENEFYNPINKPDVIDKWMHSEDAPHPNDTIVVIDPDNWLLKDVSSWTRDVTTKHAVGMQAYYHSQQPKIDKLWRTFCLNNCEAQVDLVGVPYLIKASDLKEVAPLWKKYTLLIKEKLTKDHTFNQNYKWLGIDWSAEMFGYNFACAHLQIKSKIADDLQVRDVETTMDHNRWKNRPMIHMGRAWFPNEMASLAEPWRHTEGMPEFGIQVWCKCNRTGGDIFPWPIPKGLDFVSEHTLRILHDSREFFGPVPINETFRKPDDYYFAAP